MLDLSTLVAVRVIQEGKTAEVPRCGGVDGAGAGPEEDDADAEDPSADVLECVRVAKTEVTGAGEYALAKVFIFFAAGFLFDGQSRGPWNLDPQVSHPEEGAAPAAGFHLLPLPPLKASGESA